MWDPQQTSVVSSVAGAAALATGSRASVDEWPMLLSDRYTDGPRSHLIVCERAGCMAVVDPDRSWTDGGMELAKAGGWRVCAVLLTTSLGAAEDRASLLGSLQGALGLDPDPTHVPVPMLEGVLRVGPVAGWPTPPDTLLLRAGDRLLELRLHPGEATDGTLRVVPGQPSRPGLQFDRVVVELGAAAIEVVPLSCDPPTVGYRVRDQLIVGSAVQAGTSAGPGLAPPATLLDLPDHVVIHAGVVVGGVGISTVGAERRRRAALALRDRIEGSRSRPPTLAPLAAPASRLSEPS